MSASWKKLSGLGKIILVCISPLSLVWCESTVKRSLPATQEPAAQERHISPHTNAMHVARYYLFETMYQMELLLTLFFKYFLWFVSCYIAINNIWTNTPSSFMSYEALPVLNISTAHESKILILHGMNTRFTFWMLLLIMNYFARVYTLSSNTLFSSLPYVLMSLRPYVLTLFLRS